MSGRSRYPISLRTSRCVIAPLLLVISAGSLSGQSSWAPADAAAARPQAPSYVGAEVCRACHQEAAAAWEATTMGRVLLRRPRNELEARACEACHGPGEDHVRGAGDRTKIFRFGRNSPASVAEQNTQCLQCHESGARQHWSGSVHEGRNLACVTCHTVMRSVSPERQLARETVADVCYQCHLQRRAQGQLSAHMPVREGRVTCTDCHNPHGTATPKLLVENSVNEVCYRCHAERRGPFLWEHPPVTENCATCHEPHGSMNTYLLRVREPRLCQRCHIESRHPTTPQGETARFVFDRSCTNCHSQIHGSNHPSGMRFHR